MERLEVDEAISVPVVARNWQEFRHLVEAAMIGTFGLERVKAWRDGGEIHSEFPIICSVKVFTAELPDRAATEFLEALNRVPIILLVRWSLYLASYSPLAVKANDISGVTDVTNTLQERGLLAA